MSRRTRIARMLALAVVGCSATARPARAQSAYFSATGKFGEDDHKKQYFDFSVGTDTTSTFRTWSSSGGTNAAGDVIPSGGVDPDLFLMQGGGVIEWNDDTFGYDAYIHRTIGAGAYRLEQDFFYPPNSGLWAVDLTSSSAGSMTLNGLPNN